MTISTFISGLAEIADDFDAFMIDLDGTMHSRQTPYPGAVDAMTRLTELGKSVIVLTNSGTRAVTNMARVEAIGFPRSSYTMLVSSGEVIWQALRTGAFGPPFESGGRVCVVGKAGEDYGLDGLELIAEPRPEMADFILLAGSDCPQTSLDQYSNILAPAAAQHVPALCADPDQMVWTEAGPQPSSGAIARVFEELGGRVTYVGKPFSAMYRSAAGRAGSDAGRVLCIGDSLAHDIAGGEVAGYRTALVRTGVLTDVDDAGILALIEAASHKPDFVLPGLVWS